MTQTLPAKPLTLRERIRAIPRELITLIGIALVFAIIWWLLALSQRNGTRFLVWDDQTSTFLSALTYLRTPYQSAGFFNPPWAMILLIPFDPLPVEIATLAQISLYFVLLAGMVYKFGGNKWSLIVALTSLLAVDTALEINIDWMVCIGLLVPAVWSAPFLMIKPQAAFGYVFSFKRRDFVRASILGLVVILAAFLIWGNWPLALWNNMQEYQTNVLVNLAPKNILTLPVALIIGILLGVYAFRKRDPILCTTAGLFFVPYTAPNSVLIIFTLLACRWPKATLLVSVVSWFVVIKLLIK